MPIRSLLWASALGGPARAARASCLERGGRRGPVLPGLPAGLGLNRARVVGPELTSASTSLASVYSCSLVSGVSASPSTPPWKSEVGGGAGACRGRRAGEPPGRSNVNIPSQFNEWKIRPGLSSVNSGLM